MSDELFDKLEMTFFPFKKDLAAKRRQAYYNCLADCLKSNEIYMKADGEEEPTLRPITEGEKEEMLYMIGCWLLSLN